MDTYKSLDLGQAAHWVLKQLNGVPEWMEISTRQCSLEWDCNMGMLDHPHILEPQLFGTLIQREISCNPMLVGFVGENSLFLNPDHQNHLA